jgi:thiol:disulfide interchange protein
MKRVLTLLMASALALFAEMEWAMDWEDALQESRESGKPILVMLSMENCHYCNLMKTRVFTRPKVEEFLNLRFVPLEIDIENEKVPAGLKPYGTPTFYVVADGGKRISRPIVGAAGADAFLERMQKVLKKLGL